MKTFVVHSVFFALIGLMLSPLSVAHASSPPADSVHFCAPFDYEQWRRDRPRPAAKRTTGLNVGEPRTVRMIYFRPNDRPFRQTLVDSIKRTIKQSQAFFAEQMQAHGYGNKTFRFETDEQGEPLVHRFDGKHSATYYYDSYYEDSWIYSERHYWIRSYFFEVAEAFDISENIYVVYRDFDFPNNVAQGERRSKKAGRVWLPLSAVNWRTLSHELGHAFGLPHDFRDGAYIMSYGWQEIISQCAAKFLSVNPYFNSDIPWPDTWPEEGIYVDSSSPRIELRQPLPPSGPVLFGPYMKQIGDDGWVEVKYAAGLESLPIRFRITDSDGIHQVLFSPYPGYGSGGLRECRSFDGEKDVVVEFNYDGSSMPADPEKAITNLSDSPHLIHFAVVDTDGNMREAQFDLKETAPSADFYTLTKISGDEQQGSAGTALAEPFVVSVLDQSGAAFAGVIVTFSVTAGGGSLSATTATTDANGRARSTLTLGSEPGTNTVVATVAGLEPETFTATAIEQTPYTLMKVSGDGQGGQVGEPLAAPFVVSVLDQNGSAFAGAVVTFSVTAGEGTLSSTTATTNTNGRARTTLTLGSEPGVNTVAATVEGLGTATFTATATEDSQDPEPDPQWESLSAMIDDVTSAAEHGRMTFTVRLNPTPTAPTTVEYATASQTAKAGEDYEAAIGTLHFGANQNIATFTVQIRPDQQDEPNETFAVKIIHPSTHALLAEATGTITDDDGATPPEADSDGDDEMAFGFAGEVEDQAYTAGTAITDLLLPEATGGEGEITYRVLGLPAGLSFDAATRTISGTPEAATLTRKLILLR